MYVRRRVLPCLKPPTLLMSLSLTILYEQEKPLPPTAADVASSPLGQPDPRARFGPANDRVCELSRQARAAIGIKSVKRNAFFASADDIASAIGDLQRAITTVEQNHLSLLHRMGNFSPLTTSFAQITFADRISTLQRFPVVTTDGTFATDHVRGLTSALQA